MIGTINARIFYIVVRVLMAQILLRLVCSWLFPVLNSSLSESVDELRVI